MASATAQFDFPGFPVSQAHEEKENALMRYLRLTQECGGLIPQAMLPAALCVCKQRVSQLVAAGHFDVHQIGGRAYITGDSFEAFLLSERKVGRPVKSPTIGALAKGMKDSLRKS
jgi:hypothetical protein